MQTQEVERMSIGRHFYAVNVKGGKEIPYGFTRLRDRERFVNSRDNAHSISARDVYTMLDKHRGEVIAATKTNRLFVAPSVERVKEDRGERVVLA